jgi:hypothetical protein
MNASPTPAGAVPDTIAPNARPAAQTPADTQALRAGLHWLVPQLRMLPLAARRCLVRNPLNGASLELSSGEYAVLSACEGCRPLAEHEARAAQQLSAPPEHRPAIHELIERCAQQGLLMSLHDLVARFGSPGQGVAPRFAGIAVRTADRPQDLRRVFDGAVALQARTGVAYPWHVVDDSRQIKSRRANQETLGDYRMLDSTYHDLSAENLLDRELGAAYPDLADEIHALLDAAHGDEVTYGRPLNYLLLRFAGHRLLLLDDDVAIDPRRPPLTRAGVEVSVTREAALWYETLDAAYAACPPLNCDPVEAHLRWLGLPLAEAWTQAERDSGGLRVGQLPGDAAARFAPDARVVFTRNHLLGDPGWAAFAAQQLVLSDETRVWLAANPDAVRYAFESQIHWRGQVGLRMAPRMLSTTTLKGIDNSRLMPPTLRAAAGEDIVFGEAACCVYPNGWTVDLPFALPHLRTKRRQWLTPRDKLVLEPARFLVTYARACRPAIAAESPSQRMARLGEMFRDLGEAGDARLIAMLEEQSAEYASEVLFGIHEQLDDATVPAAWKSTLRAWHGLQILKLDPESLRASVAPPATVRALAREYGRTLMAWPRLWAHCRERFR